MHHLSEQQRNPQNHHGPIPQDSDLTQLNPSHHHLLPILSPAVLLQSSQNQQQTLSIPLQSLPLRPSTLTALLRSGFSTTGDVMNSCQTETTSNDAGNHDRSSSTDGENNDGGHNATASSNDSNKAFGRFSKELGCSPLQAADYAHEINDALGSVGLPRESMPDGNDINGENDATTDNNIMAPHAAIYPATAASILRSKANNHFPMSNDNHAQNTGARQIVSFSQALDVLLGGGLALSELTEIAGLPGVGKTQLAMQLCADSRLPAKYGGVEGCAVVIDAEGSWSSAAGGDRLFSIAVALVDHVKSIAYRKLTARRAKEGAGANINEADMASLVPSWLTPEWILDGIHIFRVHDEASQTCTLYNLPKFLLELEQKGTPAKMVAIDSLAFHYRVSSSSSFTGNGNKSNSLSTTHNLTRMAAFLTELASEFNLAVLAMNHLTTRIEKDDSNNPGGTKLVPALGESWAHSITSRLMIDHYRHCHTGASSSTSAHAMDEVRTCTLVKSPHKPNGTALFMITDKGIRGVPPQFFQSQATKRARLD